MRCREIGLESLDASEDDAVDVQCGLMVGEEEQETCWWCEVGEGVEARSADYARVMTVWIRL